MNGVKLAPADFTATNGSDVVLATGAAVGDIIEVVAYTAFEVLNQNFTGNTSTQDLTVSGNLTVTGTTITIDTATAQNVDLGDGDLGPVRRKLLQPPVQLPVRELGGV